eukprot:2534118-Rhodomonas_salina.3
MSEVLTRSFRRPSNTVDDGSRRLCSCSPCGPALRRQMLQWRLSQASLHTPPTGSYIACLELAGLTHGDRACCYGMSAQPGSSLVLRCFKGRGGSGERL